MRLRDSSTFQRPAYSKTFACGHPGKRVSLLRSAAVDATTTSFSTAKEQSTATDTSIRMCPVLSSGLLPLPQPRLGLLQRTYLGWIKPRDAVAQELEGHTIGMSTFVGLPVAVVGDLNVAKELLSHEATGTVTIGWPPSTLALLGKHAISVQTSPARHRQMRQLIMPALTPESVELYLQDIFNVADEALASWAHASQQEGRTVLAAPKIKRMTFKIITRVVMGLHLDEKEIDEMSNDFKIWVNSLFTPLAIDSWPFPFHASMQARERLLARIMKQVHAVRSDLEKRQLTDSHHTAQNHHSIQAAGSWHAHSAGGSCAGISTGSSRSYSSSSHSAGCSKESSGASTARRHMSTVERLLTEQGEDGQMLSDEAAGDQLLTLLFAGHDTTSAQLTYIISVLSTHPEVVKKLQQEQANIIAQYGPGISPQAMRAMQYAQAVAQEAMRTRPIIPAVLRRASDEFGLSSHKVPKGHLVSVDLGHISQQDPRWPRHGTADDPLDSARFNPDRFMTPEGQQQGSQVPFGLGSHKCAGMALAQAEAKLFLAALARGYTIKADNNTTWKQQPIPTPGNGLPIWTERI